MLEMNIKYNSHNSALLLFWGNFLKCHYFWVAVSLVGWEALLLEFYGNVYLLRG